jgi:integrase/recombinase XerC
MHPTHLTARRETPAGRLLASHLAAGKNTARAYSGDLRALAAYLGKPDEQAAVLAVLTTQPHEGNAMAEGFSQWLRACGLAPATVWRRVMSLRSLVRRARKMGLLYWSVDVTPVHRPRPLRDTRGPGAGGWAKMLNAASGRRDAKGIRDLAILRTMHDLALRAAEVLSLDLCHLDLAQRRLHVLGKGEAERLWLSLPLLTVDVVAAWIAARGSEEGPLFTSDWAGAGSTARRLSYSGLYRIIVDLAAGCQIRCTPHGLRHQATTAALDATGGDVLRVQRFTRHRCVETVLRYNDAREDRAGEIADMVARGAMGRPSVDT